MENITQFESAAVSDRGLSDKRPQNEDSFLEQAEFGIFVVADGVGGAQAGDVASQMAVEIIGEAFSNLSLDADPEDTMKLAIERANEAIFQMSHELQQLSTMATTVVALHVARDVATIAHVGDSRLYRVDAAGQLFRETADHSVVEEEVRAGRMTAEQAAHHPSRNVISRALGAEGDVLIDIKMLIVHPSTTFLLCSDGITRHIDDWELAALLSSNSRPDEICLQMKQICYDRGAEDNLTAVIVRFPAQGVNEGMLDRLAFEQEEATVASIRTLPENNEFATTKLDSRVLEQSQPQTSNLSIDDDSEPYLLEDASTLYKDEPNPQDLSTYSSSSVIVPAQSAAGTNINDDSRPIADTGSFTYTEESKRPGLLGKLVSSLGLLLAGLLLGFTIFYLWPQSKPEQVADVPVITEQKSNNVALTTFEDGRRLVDKDPANYILANAAKPESAEDYFLLGRAFFLTGKGWEARKSFDEARGKLGQTDSENAKTIATEIAIALAVIDSPRSYELFVKDFGASAAAANPTNTAVDSNAASKTQ